MSATREIPPPARPDNGSTPAGKWSDLKRERERIARLIATRANGQATEEVVEDKAWDKTPSPRLLKFVRRRSTLMADMRKELGCRGRGPEVHVLARAQRLGRLGAEYAQLGSLVFELGRLR